MEVVRLTKFEFQALEVNSRLRKRVINSRVFDKNQKVLVETDVFKKKKCKVVGFDTDNVIILELFKNTKRG